MRTSVPARYFSSLCAGIIKEKKYDEWEKIMNQWRKDFLQILTIEDQKNFFCSMEIVPLSQEEKLKLSALSFEDWKNRISPLLSFFPHGVLKQVLKPGKNNLESELFGLIRLSNNLAKLTIENGKIEILSSLRFMQMEEGDMYSKIFHDLSRVFHLEISEKVGYPSWTPDFNSPLLKEVSRIYEELYGSVPEHKAIHAGLECGIIAAKIPGLRAISFGPTIVDAHSPDERVNIKSVTDSWIFLKAILSRMGSLTE
jgi:dipeptidase D